MSLVQVSLQLAQDMRVTRDTAPVFQLDLGDHQRVAGVQHYWTADMPNRETVDHYAMLWIESRL